MKKKQKQKTISLENGRSTGCCAGVVSISIRAKAWKRHWNPHQRCQLEFFRRFTKELSLFSLQQSTRAYEHSGFILRLILDGAEIKFEPDLKDFELVLINVFDVMMKNISTIPRVETKLYSEWVSIPQYPAPSCTHMQTLE